MDMHDVAVCGQCGAVSMDLDVTRCPNDGSVMGEVTMTRDEISQAASLHRLLAWNHG